MNSPETIYIIDGSAYIYRAFYAMRNFTNKAGFPTNALFGFTQMIRTLLEQENPDYVAIVFDDFENDEQTFRHRIYPEYKANRSEMPEDLKPQIPFFSKIVEALNIPCLVQSDVEADDIIATMCRRAEAAELDVCIISADKDLMQLLEHENVRMIDTMRKKTFTRDTAKERFGVEPARIKYVMALAGDSSDNIPGVPGIGEKTGGKLIDEFGDLETLLASVDQVSGKKRKENLTEFADQARMSLELVTLKDDLEIEFDLEALKLSAPDFAKLTELFNELDFGRPLRDIKAWMKKRGWLDDNYTPAMPKKVVHDSNIKKNYRTVLTEEQLQEVIAACEKSDRFAFDLETTSLNPMDAVIVGISVAWADHDAVYIPVWHRYIGVPPQLDLNHVLESFRELLESDLPKVVCQNFKYEQTVLLRHGVNFKAIEWDTMLMSYLLDPGRLSQGLSALASDLLSYTMMEYSDVAGKGRKQINFEMVDLEPATKYAAEDADVTLMVCNAMEPTVEKTDLRRIHDDIEVPLSYVLAKMERTGVCIDTDILHELSRSFEKELIGLLQEIEECAGQKINPNSPMQLREVLFEKLELPVKKQTKSGPSTDSSVLEELAELHPLPNLVLEYRSFSKLKGTYIDALPALIRSDTGRVHSDFNQAVAATGRLSSSNPNLQNIPIRTTRGREIRRAFIPQPDWVLICADYSQIELRIMAHMAQDPILLDAYSNGDDVHAITASKIFDIPLSEVDRDQRAAGKTINFGVMYGMGPNRLSRDLNITRNEAKQYISQYFERYSAVREFFDQLVATSTECGYAETLFGRRRIIDDLLEGTWAQRSFAERVAVNTPIQGTAADIIKIAMLDIDRALEASDVRMNMLLQVHDELVFEVHPDDVEKGKTLVIEKMENVAQLDVPLKVDCGVGPNWMDAK